MEFRKIANDWWNNLPYSSKDLYLTKGKRMGFIPDFIDQFNITGRFVEKIYLAFNKKD